MTTIDELREVLEHRAGVPDPSGMVEAARTRAQQVRRRRRMTAAVAVAAVVAVAVPVTVARLRTAEPLPPAAPAPYRGPGETTVGVQPDPRFFVLTRRIDATGQLLTIRPVDSGSKDWGGAVAVHDPGSYEPAWLDSSEKITVGGRPAHLAVTVVNRATEPGRRGSEFEGASVIGWREPSGAWVVVSEAQSVPALRRLADSVRLGPPRPVSSPVAFGWLPDGLRLHYIETAGDPSGPPAAGFHAMLGFAAADQPPADLSPRPDLGDLPMSVSVQARTARGWTELVAGPGEPPQWRTVGGQRAWYRPAGSKGYAAGTAHLLIENSKCGIQIGLGAPVRISEAELDRMVALMTFADCTGPATWIPPVG